MKEITDLTLERWRLVLTRLSVVLEDYEYMGAEDVKTLAQQLDVIIDDIYALQKKQGTERMEQPKTLGEQK